MNSEKYLSDIYKELVFKSKELTMNQSFQLKSLMQNIGKQMQLHLRREQQRMELTTERLPKSIQTCLRKRVSECDNLAEKLHLLSPENVLKRGYSITMKDGKAVKNAAELTKGQVIETRFYEGTISSTVN